MNRRAPDAVFLSVEGVADRNAAEKLRGELLYIDRAHAVELDEDTNFLCDLIGLRGVDVRQRGHHLHFRQAAQRQKAQGKHQRYQFFPHGFSLQGSLFAKQRAQRVDEQRREHRG